MKKPKISLDTAKLKTLLIHHCEKLVLAVVVLLVAFFVYRGYQLSGLEQAQTPDKLSAAAQTTVGFIEADRWKELAESRKVSLDIAALVDKGQQPSDASLYRLPIPWNKQDFPKLVPRKDPTIYPPLHVQVVSMVGPLAMYSDGTEIDPLQEVLPDPADVPKLPRPKKRPARNKLATDAYQEMPGDGGSADGGSQRSARGRGRRPPRGGEMMPGDMMPGEMMPGAYGEGMGAAAGINPESIFGFKADAAALAKPARINVVTAVVHYEKQIEEFDRVLKTALDYSDTRDFPRFIQYGIKRIDVTDGADIADESNWKQLGVRAALAETDNWAGFPEEVLDPNYLDFEVLTHPAPPFIQRDLWRLLTHPDVPLATLASQGYGPNAVNPASETQKPGVETDLPSITPRGIPGVGGEYMPGASMPGMGSADGGRQRPQRGGMGEGYGGAGGMRPQPTRQQPGMGSADGGYGEGYGGQLQTVAIPKYKLIRFSDTTVVPGREYRYKLSIYVEDPNHPTPAFAPPSVQALDPEVRNRLKNVAATGYYRMSDWSEPSDVATLPAAESFHAGKVKPAVTVPVVPGKPEVTLKEPSGTALAVVFDPAKGVDVPSEKEVYRGSTLNFTADVEVIHPTLSIVRKLEKYGFRTDAVVVDIMGGEPLELVDKTVAEKPLDAPGEILFFDSAGNLHVQDESADVESFRRYLVPKVEMMPTTQPGDALGAPGETGSADGGDVLGPRIRRPAR